MSSLTTETKEVWVIIRIDLAGREWEFAEYDTEDAAIQRAREEIADYIEQFNSFCYFRIEHRIVPIYK